VIPPSRIARLAASATHHFDDESAVDEEIVTCELLESLHGGLEPAAERPILLCWLATDRNASMDERVSPRH